MHTGKEELDLEEIWLPSPDDGLMYLSVCVFLQASVEYSSGSLPLDRQHNNELLCVKRSHSVRK